MNTPTQDTSWFENELAGALTDKSSSKNYEKEFPFKAYIVDQFEGHTEDGYSCFRNYRSLDEAVAVARRITEEAILENGFVYRWHGEGDAGLVYQQDKLVWDGVREYTDAGGSEETLKALEYAINAHRGGFRKGSKIPYIVHPLGVAAILMRYNCTNKLICCGYLHDTMEDTKVTFEDLKKSQNS